MRLLTLRGCTEEHAKRAPLTRLLLLASYICCTWPDSLLHLLQVWAAADAARYECDLGAIAFRPTLMFQTRTFAFALRNAGGTRLPFQWAVLCGKDIDTSGLYRVRCMWTLKVSGCKPRNVSKCSGTYFYPSESFLSREKACAF